MSLSLGMFPAPWAAPRFGQTPTAVEKALADLRVSNPAGNIIRSTSVPVVLTSQQVTGQQGPLFIVLPPLRQRRELPSLSMLPDPRQQNVPDNQSPASSGGAKQEPVTDDDQYIPTTVKDQENEGGNLQQLRPDIDAFLKSKAHE